MDSPGWKNKSHAVRLPLITEVISNWNDQQLHLRSLNVSESGMLLQGSADLKVGNEAGLEFKIAEFRASLNVMGRVVRQEAPDRMAVGFVGLAPEDINAIQLYVMGRLRDMSPERDLSGIGMHRLFTP